MAKTIAVDFDGVIHRYSKGWQDGSIYDEPHVGAKEGIETLKKLGFRIVIYSARCYNGQVKEMQAYLDKYNIPYDEIHDKPEKPICCLFIDDNAYRFKGEWEKELPIILTHLSKYLFVKG